MSLPSKNSELACKSTYSNLISLVTCDIDTGRNQALQNTVRIAMTLKNGVINEQDRFGFSIDGIINPPST